MIKSERIKQLENEVAALKRQLENVSVKNANVKAKDSPKVTAGEDLIIITDDEDEGDEDEV